jgi:hypothetical protein
VRCMLPLLAWALVVSVNRGGGGHMCSEWLFSRSFQTFPRCFCRPILGVTHGVTHIETCGVVLAWDEVFLCMQELW